MRNHELNSKHQNCTVSYDFDKKLTYLTTVAVLIQV